MATLVGTTAYRTYFTVWTAVNPMQANSDNAFTLTLALNGVRQTTGTVTLTLKRPDGTTALNAVSVPHTSNGVYEYTAAPSACNVAGTYTATWNAVAATKTWQREEPVVVVL